jgi:alcohol dehydrogenase class IV
MALYETAETPGQETSEEQGITLEMILEFLPDLSDEELAAISAEIDTLVKKREKSERRAAIKQIKELSQKYKINLSEIPTKPRKNQKKG